MINDTFIGIADRLEWLFQNPTVYFDKLPQGFNAPCFFVKLINSTRKPCLGRRSELKLDFDIMYYPKNNPEDAIRELNNIGYTLLWGLELINVVDLTYRGTELNFKIEDGVLHFFVTYRLMIFEVVDKKPKMESLSQQYRFKN